MRKSISILALVIVITVPSFGQWVQTSFPMNANEEIMSIVESNGVLFAGSKGDGLFRSYDNGDNWSAIPLNSGLASGYIYSLDVIGNRILAGTHLGVFYSDDDGDTWQTEVGGPLDGNLARCIYVYDSVVFAGFNAGIYTSLDSGGTWSFLTDIGSQCNFIHDFEAVGSSVFSATSCGVWRLDSGTTYFTSSNGTTPLHTYGTSTLLNHNGELLVGTAQDGIYKSSDGGLTWNQVNSGITSTWIRDLHTYGDSIMAASWGGGVYVSSNAGASWSTMNVGLTDTLAWSLGSSMNDLFVGTQDMNIFKRSLSTDVQEIEVASTALRLHPNPSTGFVNITSNENVQTELRIYDSTGRFVHVEVLRGSSSIVDLGGLVPGYYSVEVASEELTKVGRLLIQR